MQQNYVDAADRFKSLDDIWYFGGQDEHRQVATMDHVPQNRDEIDIRIGNCCLSQLDCYFTKQYKIEKGNMYHESIVQFLLQATLSV